MAKTYVTGTGKAIEIGRELGKGGEGAVYEVPTNHHWAAKLYDARHQPDASKQAKLRYMATITDVELLRYTAWPQDTLHKTANGPVVGFLMPKVSGRAPIHMLYNPAHRRQDYPEAAWNFLVFAARNTAAAFAAIHHRGYVLGDVNQQNVLVGTDSKVVLIDTDSFQLNANGLRHLCEVRAPHFTPPELQGAAYLDRAPRTSNHDNFGLALLIFHLLFGGRHPYSGVPLRDDAGGALENDIQAFRYAYAPDGQLRGFNPPPKSIPIAIVPDPIQAMFTLAFTENGAKRSRPTAKQWVTALDGLRGQLKRCATTPMHVYPDHIGRCPWCALKQHGAIYFLDGAVGVTPTGNTDFVLARAWGEIESVLPPPPIPIPNISALAVAPAPLPSSAERLSLQNLFSFGSLRKAERAKRQAARDAAQEAYGVILAQAQREITPEMFNKKKQSLVYLRDEYQLLPKREEREIANLYSTAEARQKHQFLKRQFLDTASISGIGPSKTAALLSFGIETAADVTWKTVISVRGIGEVLTRALVDWRKACESRFVFDPHLAVTEADKNSVRAQIAARKRIIQVTLNGGAEELQRLRREMMDRASALTPVLQEAARKLAQARADLNSMWE